MIARAAILLVIVLIGAGSTGQTRALEGCTEIARLARATERVTREWWNQTAESLARSWPDEIRPLEPLVEPGGAGLIGTRSRMIKSVCECCDTFHFQEIRRKGSDNGVHLTSVTIYYSTSTEVAGAAAARQLVEAALRGASKESLIAGVRDVADHRIDWEDSASGIAWWVDVKISEANSIWTVYFNITAASIV